MSIIAPKSRRQSPGLAFMAGESIFRLLSRFEPIAGPNAARYNQYNKYRPAFSWIACLQEFACFAYFIFHSAFRRDLGGFSRIAAQALRHFSRLVPPALILGCPR